MLTYNHQDYIAQAIGGVIMQKTTFQIEIIVANDNSSDQTEDIISGFRKDYPMLVKGFYNHKNLGPKNNFIKAHKKATGEYIALCEGDDYWTDPLKLQKQVDFLESNSRYLI